MDWNSYWVGRQDARNHAGSSGDAEGCLPLIGCALVLPLALPVILMAFATYFDDFSLVYCLLLIATGVINFYAVKWLFSASPRVAGTIGAIVYFGIGFLYRRAENGPGWESFALSQPMYAAWDWAIIFAFAAVGGIGFYAICEARSGGR